jgi:hypothetical protein
MKVVEITAKKYEYSGSPAHVKLGAKIQLKISATDHDPMVSKSGLFLMAVRPAEPPSLVSTSAPDCWLLRKGETTIIDFLTQTPGSYAFKSFPTCGLGHKGMNGQIIVDRWNGAIQEV